MLAELILVWLLANTPCPANPAALDIIPTREGFYLDRSLPARFNNPGALKFAGQGNALWGPHNFAVFTTPEAGWEALEGDLETKASRGCTPQCYRRAWRYLFCTSPRHPLRPLLFAKTGHKHAELKY
jgi:hypothetical protein